MLLRSVKLLDMKSLMNLMSLIVHIRENLKLVDGRINKS
jgi:hypothetical protein